MPLPEVFGSWLLVRRLGGRAMTEVFVAVRLGDPGARWFVLKRPPLGERASGPVAEALRREARVLREAKGPGVVALEDAGELAGLPYVVVEHVRGVPLDRLIAAGPLPVEVARLVARDLARALAGLHERGWVHGDVAPSNVMIDETGELVLLDFGLALRADEPRAAPQGKAGYVSPQAALGKPATSADDVYAWGVVAAEAALGGRLFDHADLAQAAARTSLPPGTAIEGLDDVEPALADDAAKRPALDAVAGRIAVDAGARDELARLVAEAAARPEPTSAEASDERPRSIVVGPVGAPPLVERALLGSGGAGARSAPVAASEAPAGRPVAAPPRRLSRAVVPLVALALIGAFAVGFVLGRRPGRTREGSITLPMLPPRTEIAIDGRTMLVPEPGRAIPLEPGRHVLTLQAGRREARDYEIVVQPGEHVLVVNVQVAAGGGRRQE